MEKRLIVSGKNAKSVTPPVTAEILYLCGVQGGVTGGPGRIETLYMFSALKHFL